MTSLPKDPTAKSVAFVLNQLQADPIHIAHIQQYISNLQQHISDLEQLVHTSAPTEVSSKRATEEHQDPVQAPTILIVEDDVAINAMIQTILENEGYHTMSAETGYDGIQLAKQHSPDLIICDIHLPGMHGLDVIRQFKLLPPVAHVPIIMLTADLFKAEESFDIGANEYVMKPIRKNQLMGYVSKYLPL